MSIQAIATGYDDLVGLVGISGLFRVDGTPSITITEARVLAANLIEVCDHIETSWSHNLGRVAS
jgi:hypothetical protein